MATQNGGSHAILPEEPPTVLYIGQHETRRSEKASPALLRRAQDAGYDVLTARITTDDFQSRVLQTIQNHADGLASAANPQEIPLPLIAPLSPQDTDLVPEDSNSSILAMSSPWIDLGSHDPLIAHISRQVLNLEVAYAAFVGVSNIVVHGPLSGSNTTQYARAILEATALGPYIQVHLLMPMTGELEQDISDESTHLSELAREQYLSGEDQDEEDSELFGAWEAWNVVRTVCSYSSKLSIALELPRQLPSIELQSRWYSEPVRLLMLPRTSFIRNAKGFPVLSKQHQQYLTRLLRLRFAPWAILSDVGPIPASDATAKTTSAPGPTPAEAAATAQGAMPNDATQHLRYLRHLQQTQPSRPPIERFGQGYQDYMQSPLQPLTDNLESITYEVFEKDPVKYEWYERAIALALKDLQAKMGGSRALNVAVVGAGRGPLVTRVLQASKSTGVKVNAYAVEKNPNAFVLLQRRNVEVWSTQVTVVKSDMRTWPGPKSASGEIGKVDILVSELLGSFADNELSPECLDGVQHVLHPEHGISIPQSYSAHVTPIASPKMQADLLRTASTDLNQTTGGKWQLPYVVMLHQYDYLSTEPSTIGDPQTPLVKDAWSFSHPASAAVLSQSSSRAGGTIDAGGATGGDGTNEHNARSCGVRFSLANRGVCHGLAGYFETVLYSSKQQGKIIELSTNPVTMQEKSNDMISWFPIFFPFKTPLCVPDGAEMLVSMWRQTDDRKVWYEWMAEVFVSIGGRKMKVGGSELHSSRENGCLM